MSPAAHALFMVAVGKLARLATVRALRRLCMRRRHTVEAHVEVVVIARAVGSIANGRDLGAGMNRHREDTTVQTRDVVLCREGVDRGCGVEVRLHVEDVDLVRTFVRRVEASEGQQWPESAVGAGQPPDACDAVSTAAELDPAVVEHWDTFAGARQIVGILSACRLQVISRCHDVVHSFFVTGSRFFLCCCR